jgi:hypothetical protein
MRRTRVQRATGLLLALEKMGFDPYEFQRHLATGRSEPLVEAKAEERKAEKPVKPRYVRKTAVKNPVTMRIAEIKRDLHILSQLLDLAAKDPSMSKAFLLFWDDLSLQVEEIRKLTARK